MIRTDIVELTTIAGIAYKQRVPNGGAGLTVITKDDKAVVTIDKRSGKYIVRSVTRDDVFTPAVFDEAFRLTKSLSLKKQKSIRKLTADFISEEADDLEEDTTIADSEVLESRAYRALLEAYTDKNQTFSFSLMNKDMIKFAHRSTSVRRMRDERRPNEEILLYVVSQKVYTLSKQKVREDFVKKLIEIMDVMETRSAFKELKAALKPVR
jgi:hypothetical protein